MAFAPLSGNGLSGRVPPSPEVVSTPGPDSNLAPKRQSIGSDRVALRAERTAHCPCDQGALFAPQGVAEADDGDAGGNGEQSFVLRQDARSAAAHRARTLARKTAMPKMKPPAT